MATENKSIKVHPALEQTMIENYEKFGWNLVSSQEIHSQTSHSDEDTYFVYHYTTTTNYVKLVFTRDRDMTNRDKVLPLETEYWECFDTYMSAPKLIPGKLICGFSLLYIIAVIAMIASGEANFISAFPFLLVGISPVLIRHLCYYMPRKKKADICLARCVDIEEEVEKLVKR